METKGELAKAIIAVMKAVKGVDKNMVVGEGKNSYQGVADEDVKDAIGIAMQENGLCLLPIGVEAKVKVDRWEEKTQYGLKNKQSIFTEANTKYLLLHTSGESQIIEGYGHGVDSQDKSAGKATTYALKNTLLYTFLVPTRKVDDTDKVHSDDHSIPKYDPADMLRSAKNLQDLAQVYSSLTPAQKKTFMPLKDELKSALQLAN